MVARRPTRWIGAAVGKPATPRFWVATVEARQTDPQAGPEVDSDAPPREIRHTMAARSDTVPPTDADGNSAAHPASL